MSRKLLRALGALALGLALSSFASAANVGMEAGYNGPLTWDSSTPALSTTGGDFYDPSFVKDYSAYSYDLDLTGNAGALVSIPLINFDIGPFGFPIFTFLGTQSSDQFTGTYNIFYNGTSVSSGTATAAATWLDDNGPTFSNGTLTQTAGTGFPLLPGATTFHFSGDISYDGPAYFQGTLSADTVQGSPAAAPLPSSATAGLTLISLLAAGHLVRRRKCAAVA